MRLLQTARRRPATLPVDATVLEAAEMMDQAAVGAVVVVDAAERAVGIVTDRDLTVRALARRLPADARLDGVMSTELLTLPEGHSPADALTIFRTHGVRRLPVVDDEGRMTGMVTVDDVLGALVADLADATRPITGQVLFGHPEPGLPAVVDDG